MLTAYHASLARGVAQETQAQHRLQAGKEAGRALGPTLLVVTNATNPSDCHQKHAAATGMQPKPPCWQAVRPRMVSEL